jgi:hypothetical protein
MNAPACLGVQVIIAAWYQAKRSSYRIAITGPFALSAIVFKTGPAHPPQPRKRQGGC